MTVMGKVSVMIQCGQETVSKKRKHQKERRRVRCNYTHERTVLTKETVDGPESTHRVYERIPEGYPQEIPPPGLDPSRQWYLYEEIREFCDSRFMDEVCPLPSVQKPTALQKLQDQQQAKKGKVSGKQPAKQPAKRGRKK